MILDYVHLEEAMEKGDHEGIVDAFMKKNEGEGEGEEFRDGDDNRRDNVDFNANKEKKEKRDGD